jgi:hypothetical protein
MGSKPKVVYRIYSSVIWPMLPYAALVWWEKNTSDHCKKIVWSYLADYLLGYDRRYEHHTYGSNGDLPGSTTSATCGWKGGQAGCQVDYTAPIILKNQNGDIRLFSRWQRKSFQFSSDRMLPLEVFYWKRLVEYPFREKWQSEAEAELPSDGSLFEGQAVSGFFRRNLISRHLSLLERLSLSFRLRLTPFWLVSTTVWGSVWLVKRSAFARKVGPLYWR